MFSVWGQFIICAIFIFIGGTKLAKYGDIIAEKTGLGRLWVGVLLLAAATSLPELITIPSCAGLIGSPDLALGAILGSCVFNLMIIVLLDYMEGPGPIFLRASSRQIPIIILSIVLIGLTMLAVITKFSLTLGTVGLSSIVIALVYIVGIKKILRSEVHGNGTSAQLECNSDNLANEEEKHDGLSLKEVCVQFSFWAALVIIFSIWLSYVGESIVMITGMNESFVGNIFLAITTSLPELVVSISAIRMGAINMALGDLFGSNAINILILTIGDAFYTQGALLANASTIHLGMGLLTIILSIIAILGISLRSKKSIFRLGWDAVLMLSVYILGTVIIFVPK